MSSGGSAPPPADHVGAAQAQGQANLEAARLAAQLNRVNQYTPYGSTTYRRVGQTGSAPPSTIPAPASPTGGDEVRQSIPGTRGRIPPPNSAPVSTPSVPYAPYDASQDQWEQITELSPEQQALYESRTANQQGVANLAGNQLNQVRDTYGTPFSVNGPQRISSVGQRQYQTDINAPSVANSSVDLSGIPGLTNDFSAERQRVEDSLYGSATKRLDDQFGRQNEANRAALLNQGLREGSEGYNNAMKDMELAKQDAYGNARDRAIAAGGAEQSRLYADALRGRQQSVGEAFESATFGNQAAQQQFQNEAMRAGLYNTGQDAAFGQESQNATLANSVRDAAMREQLTTRNQPLQEFLALYGDGGGGTGVTGGNVANVAGPAPAPIFDAFTNQSQDAMNRWQIDEQQAAADNSMYAGAASTVAMIAMMY